MWSSSADRESADAEEGQINDDVSYIVMNDAQRPT
jgi:hypothetical protein